jgi:hypothetical protein
MPIVSVKFGSRRYKATDARLGGREGALEPKLLLQGYRKLDVEPDATPDSSTCCGSRYDATNLLNRAVRRSAAEARPLQRDNHSRNSGRRGQRASLSRSSGKSGGARHGRRICASAAIFVPGGGRRRDPPE